MDALAGAVPAQLQSFRLFFFPSVAADLALRLGPDSERSFSWVLCFLVWLS